jgi:ABC-type transport system involved in multi-copper enzyme maturation permease subunit
MIATIKSEWRKNRFRPAFLVGSGLMAAITVLFYSVSWYQATHPGSAESAVSILSLYPSNFVNNAMGAGFPLGAAMAIVLGAILSGSDYSWGTLKTVLTQGPGRLTSWTGRVIVFMAWMAILTLVMFAVGAGYSVVIVATQNHGIVWPAAIDIVKGLGTMWLLLAAFGSVGLALGVLIKQSAAALGIGLVYLLAVEILAVRFIDGLNSGAYKWIGDLFIGQNATALTQNFAGRAVSASIGAEQAVLVLAAYIIGLFIVAGALIRQRDVT